jgi:hypothetical protein
MLILTYKVPFHLVIKVVKGPRAFVTLIDLYPMMP